MDRDFRSCVPRPCSEAVQLAPILHVDFIDPKRAARDLFASPLLERLHSIGLNRNQLGDDKVALLASSPHLSRLRFLDLSNNQIGQRAIEALCASDRLPSLRYLAFEANLAPDPTPQIAETDTMSGAVTRVELPDSGRELVRRYGVKPWLSAEVLSDIYPPERGAC